MPGAACTSASVSGRRRPWRAPSNCRAAWPPPALPAVSCCQTSSMVLSPCGNSFSLLVAQPPTKVAASSATAASIQIRGMGSSCAVVDPTPLGVVVDVERLLQMYGHLGAGLHIDRREGLPVELVDPIGHVAHAAREDAARSEERRVGKECRSRWEREH